MEASGFLIFKLWTQKNLVAVHLRQCRTSTILKEEEVSGRGEWELSERQGYYYINCNIKS
jgi:hypothetical protein